MTNHIGSNLVGKKPTLTQTVRQALSPDSRAALDQLAIQAEGDTPMKIKQLIPTEQETQRLRDLIDEAKLNTELAKKRIEWVSWTDPLGNVHTGSKDEILEIVQSGSWR